MVAPLIPILAGGAVGLAGGLFGGGGSKFDSNVEIGTSKKQTSIQNTVSNVDSRQFTLNKNVSVITNSPNASSSLKATAQPQLIPTQQITPTLLPSQSSSGGTGGGASNPINDITRLLAIGGLVGVGAFFLLKDDKKK